MCPLQQFCILVRSYYQAAGSRSQVDTGCVGLVAFPGFGRAGGHPIPFFILVFLLSSSASPLCKNLHCQPKHTAFYLDSWVLIPRIMPFLQCAPSTYAVLHDFRILYVITVSNLTGEKRWSRSIEYLGKVKQLMQVRDKHLTQVALTPDQCFCPCRVSGPHGRSWSPKPGQAECWAMQASCHTTVAADKGHLFNVW